MALDDGEFDDFFFFFFSANAGMLEALVLFLAFDTGTLTRLPDRKKLFSVRGEIDHILLPQREIRVWLPPGYESSGDARYPVLYCHDGQHMMKEDEDVFPPPRSWRLGETLSEMLASDGVYKTPSIQAPIVVLIPNCHQNGTNLLGDIDFAGQPLFRRRWLEYGDTPLGRRYIDWVCDVLKPGIDAEYRTRPEPRHTHAMGSSMGGLCAFNSVWQRPDVFSNAACLSPAFNPPLLAEVATGDGEATRQRFRRLCTPRGGSNTGTGRPAPPRRAPPAARRPRPAHALVTLCVAQTSTTAATRRRPKSRRCPSRSATSSSRAGSGWTPTCSPVSTPCAPHCGGTMSSMLSTAHLAGGTTRRRGRRAWSDRCATCWAGNRMHHAAMRSEGIVLVL
jgi:enterochelin esterase-like enzyme